MNVHTWGVNVHVFCTWGCTWVSNSMCHVAQNWLLSEFLTLFTAFYNIALLMLFFFLYSPSAKVRPPTTFVSASGRMSIRSQVLSKLESTASSAHRYFTFLSFSAINHNLHLSEQMIQGQHHQHSLLVMFQCFGPTSPGKSHQFHLLFSHTLFYLGSTTVNILIYVHQPELHLRLDHQRTGYQKKHKFRYFD